MSQVDTRLRWAAVKLGPLPPSALAKFMDRISPEPTSGCWLWTGAVRKSGYGMFTVNGRPRMAHRVAYHLFRGDVPTHLTVDHLCRVRCCVNPSHLEVVTHRVNTCRGVGPTAQHAGKHYCINGHDLTDPKNVLLRRDSFGRQCRACASLRQGDYRRLRESGHKAPIDPKRKRAWWNLAHAVNRGKITRPTRCQKCGASCRPHAHHEDYGKPLDVVWLCPSCHRATTLKTEGRDGQ